MNNPTEISEIEIPLANAENIRHPTNTTTLIPPQTSPYAQSLQNPVYQPTPTILSNTPSYNLSHPSASPINTGITVPSLPSPTSYTDRSRISTSSSSMPSLPHPSTTTQPQYYREYHAPQFPHSFYDAESQSYHSNHRNVQVHGATSASHHASINSHDASSLSSSMSLRVSDPTPPNHTLEFFQSQLDELKRASVKSETEKSNLMQALANATAQLNGAYQHLNQQHQLIQNLELKLQQSTSSHQTNPTPQANIQSSNTQEDDPNIIPHAIADLLKVSSDHQQSAKFPKFHEKGKKEFKTWYDQVLAILACPPWSNVFKNIETKELKTDEEISSSISSKLFASLRLSVTGNAEKLMMTKKQAWGKGLLYLSILKSTYKETLYQADLLQKETEFSNLFIQQQETIDDFASRCIELKDQLHDHGIYTPPASFKTRFIMGLGPLFTDIQQVQEEDLPKRWQTMDIQSLVQAANVFKDEKLAVHDRNKLYRQQIKKPVPHQENPPRQNQTPTIQRNNPPNANRTIQRPNPPPKIDPLNTEDRSWAEQNLDRQMRIEMAIKNGSFDPMTFAYEVRQGKCLWHTSNHHFSKCKNINNLLLRYPHQRCYKVHEIKEWVPYTDSDFRPMSQIPPRPSNLNDTPTARQTSMIPNDQNIPTLSNNPFAPLAETPNEALGNELDNNNNLNVNNYKISSRSVCICSSQSNSSQKNDSTTATFIIDSAAYPHMMNNRNMFTNILPWHGDITHVTLADGQAHAPIEGVGTISVTIENHIVTLHDVLYVPSLSDPLFSVQKHVSQPGNYVHIENAKATIAFPTFITTIPINTEIYLQVTKNKFALPPIAKATKCEYQNNNIPFLKMSTNAKSPIKSTCNSAGYDLFNLHDIVIPPGERAKISTGIKIEIPSQHYGRIAPRSSLALQHNIDVAAGVIDSDYRGEIFPVLINNGSKPIHFPKHSKICQLLIIKISNLDLVEVAQLNKTIRNEGGFGSTDSIA